MSNWISVEEGLPRPYTEVLIWPRPDFGYTVFVGQVDCDGAWESECVDSFSSQWVDALVTHWMPLPDSPK